MLPSFLPASNSQQPTNPACINHFYCSNNNKQEGVTVEASTNSTSAASATSNVEVQVENTLTTDIRNILKESFDKSVEKKNVFISWCKANKFKLIAGVISGSYLYLLYTIQKCKSLMQNKNSWCCWKSEIETDELVERPERIVCERLLKDIQAKYIIKQTNIDFLDPFAEFIKEVKHEINLLSLYLKLHPILIKLHLNKIFFTDAKMASQAEEKLERLYFVYQSFISWHTDRNIKQI
jgi:hypothetical protein